jgi:hypothetical protein
MAIERMENLLDEDLCYELRDACACSKGGWRLKASPRIAREYQGQSLESKLKAIGLLQGSIQLRYVSVDDIKVY